MFLFKAKSKTKWLVFINLVNINLFMGLCLQGNEVIKKPVTSNSNIISTYQNISSKKLIENSITWALSYNQEYPNCFTNAISKYDQIDKATFILINEVLFLKIKHNSIEEIIHCDDGHVQKLWNNEKVTELSGVYHLDGYLWGELLKLNMKFDLASQIQDLLLNVDDVANLPIKGELKIVYLQIGEGDKKRYEILALNLRSNRLHNTNIYSYREGEVLQYIDSKGNNLKKYFNKAPIKYGMVTSFYDRKRIHPVTGMVKGHFGTDYAASKGDPIYSIGSGIIEKIEFKRNNGNYIKIKHKNGIFSQYLHMNKFKKNLSKGDFVFKNDIIGFVGETGLATAPHVCFRFWRHGEQINHLSYRDRLPRNKILDKEKLKEIKIKYNQKLNLIK